MAVGAGSKDLEGWPPSPAGRGDAAMSEEEEKVQREAGRVPEQRAPWCHLSLALTLSLEAPLGLCAANHTPVRASLETIRQQMLLYT